MKWAAFFLLMVPVMLSARGGQKADRWAHFRFLIGSWKAEKPGEVVNNQTFRFVFNGKFLKMTTHAVFEPTEKKPRGEVHEDFSIISYDGFRDKIVLRSFYSEGYMIRFVLESAGEEGKNLVFVSEAVENAPAGTRARLEYIKINDREFIEKFYVAWPDKEFTCMADNHMFKQDKE